MDSGQRVEAVEDAVKGYRDAYFPESDGFISTAIYDRYRLVPGMSFDGPAIVEERESTVIVGPGATCEIDSQFNLVVTMPVQTLPAKAGEVEGLGREAL